MESDRELILEDAASIRVAMRRIVRSTSEATERLDERIENQTLDGPTEAKELREVLEHVQALSLEVSEELDAYQQRHARWGTFRALLTGDGTRRVELARA